MAWKRLVAIAGVLTVAVYGALSAYVVAASLTPSGTCAPSEGPPPDLRAEAVNFSSRADGIRLSGWLIPNGGSRAVVLIHGIDSDAWSGAAPDLARAYSDARFDVLLFDLRAHGGSGGRRISLGHLERGDIRAAVDLLMDRGILSGRIGLHGTSYGAAMGLLAAAEIPQVGAVVADSAYADVRDLIATEVGRRTLVPGFLADSVMRPGIRGAARLFFGLDLVALAPERAVARIAPRPLLLIHGDRDPIVPPGHAMRLKDRAEDATTELWMLPGKEHTEGARSGPCNRVPSPGRAEFLRRVVSFLDVALETR